MGVEESLHGSSGLPSGLLELSERLGELGHHR